MTTRDTLPERILDKALDLAELNGWEAVSLYQVADELNISLQDIHRYYPQKDDLVEAWFDRADEAMLQAYPGEFCHLHPRERVHKVIMQWLHSLHAHRRVTRQMLAYKLEFGHVHLQVLGVMRISRTVQWVREAALLKSKDLHRILEEVCLTSIFLSCFARWLFDESKESIQTRRLLERSLRHVHSLDKE